MKENYYDPLWSEQVTLPVKRVGDRWEFLYGGDIPVKDGTYGELRFSARAIADAKFLERVTTEVRIKALGENTPLMVALSDRTQKSPYSQALPADAFPKGIPHGTTRWAIVRLGPPKPRSRPASEKQEDSAPEPGGLWLKLRGLDKCDLISSTIVMPNGFSPPTATSLNHAFTLLSRAHEKHRISNTGNAYTRFFYQDCNTRWYPLDDLRSGAIAEAERSLLHQLWTDVEKALGWRPWVRSSGDRRN